MLIELIDDHLAICTPDGRNPEHFSPEDASFVSIGRLVLVGLAGAQQNSRIVQVYQGSDVSFSPSDPSNNFQLLCASTLSPLSCIQIPF